LYFESLRIAREVFLGYCFRSLLSPLFVRVKGFHRFLATKQPFSVIEEKGEGFEKRKKVVQAVCG
jgi:hypothetical protein